MKTIIAYCFFIGICISLQAQPNSKKSIEKETNWLKFKTTEQQTVTQLASNKTLLKFQAEDELQLLKTNNDALGYQHYRYQQTYKGIPVEGAIYLMHEKENKVKQANGKLVHDLKLSTSPAINEAEALQAALKHINATLYAWEDPTHEKNIQQIKNQTDATFYPKGELVIIDPEFKQIAANHQLAYKFDIYAVEPLTRQLIYVDAINGTVLKTLEKIHDCTNANASGSTNYAGNKSFTACVENGTYTLKNNNGGGMQVFNSNNTRSNPQIPFTDTNSFFEGDPTANEVHWATEKTYEYFLNTHNRNSLDDEGMALLSWIHFGDNYNNAFWNGSWMTYGDGDNNTFSSLTAPDVVAHEMAHGVTDFSADLIYSYESGALNESFSDIFGEVAENYMLGSNDWLMGADFTVRTGKTSLRNMSNPNDPNALTQQPDTYDGDFWYTGSGDNGGVHYNSGVQNYWFYLLCEGGSGTNDNEDEFMVNAIGMEKAAAVAYRNLTEYLGPNSQYTDARAGSIAAAEDLQNAGVLTADEVEQVMAAWCAVGVGSCGTAPPDEDDDTTGTCNRLTDSLALMALYNSTNGANWTNTWDLSQPMDTWYGVDLNDDGCVLNTILTNNNLVGIIPSEIGNLNNLALLYLYKNQLNGIIPSEIGNLNELVDLSLYTNQLTGSIPPELGNLTNLKALRLSSNQLSGNIAPELGNLVNLEELSLADNQLTGSIPPELGELAELRHLILGFNQLSGSIPPELGNLSSIRQLFMFENDLSGSIPPELGNIETLERLSINSNQLSGEIPTELGSLSNLKGLHLGINQLTGNIPAELGNAIKLEYINLSSNQLSGRIPPEFSSLNSLEQLYLHYNQLSGCYHPDLADICIQINSHPNTSYISIGNNFDAPWEDFCLNGAGSCDGSAPAPVWPGDFNTDGIADIQDLLYWGAAEGFTGAPRPNASFNWSAQDCPDWALSINGINSKHQDGDGDGIVNNNDLVALIQNYGNTHNYAPLTTVGGALQYRLELTSSIPNGNTITNTYELFAESALSLPISTHGLACSIDFDDMPINSVNVDVSNSALMPDEHIDIYLDAQNRLDIALTRTDNNNQTLDGSVAKIVIGVIDVQVGDPFEIHVGNGSMMSANGNLVAVGNTTFYGSFTGGSSIISNLSVNVSATHEGCNNGGSAMAQVTGGIAPYNYSWSTSASGNEATNLTSGIYSVTVSDASGLSTSVFFQINGQTPIYDANGNLLCGSICPNYLEPSGVAPDGQYNANVVLESDAIIPEDDNVSFEAGERIRLETGFKVNVGARFSASIEECD